jgi:hypothetical protein
MIRHGILRASPPVSPLTLAMVVACFRAVAVAAIGAAVLIEPGLTPASRAAIALPSITTGADPELGAAFGAAADPPPEHDLAMSNHRCPQLGGLDNGNGFVAP